MRLSVQINSSPQAYCVLERTAEEAAQSFAQVRISPAPLNVTGVGLDADWFPAEQHLMTTDGIRLITATVDWPAVRQSTREALSIVAARPYLGRLKPPTQPCPP